MKRRTFDVIASTIGLGLAALLIVAGGLLTWAHNFVQTEVHNQLAAQKIYFPDKGSQAISSLEGKDNQAAINKYAGQQLLTGDQAEAFADHYIGVHLKGIGGGQTYAQLSGKYQQMTDAQKASPAGQELNGQIATVFKGETLRGLLLNAYAFGRMGTIAGIAAVVAFIGAGAMALLGALGLWHGHRVPRDKEVLTGKHEELNTASA